MLLLAFVTPKGEFSGKVTVQMLVIYGSFCYLSVFTWVFEFFQETMRGHRTDIFSVAFVVRARNTNGYT